MSASLVALLLFLAGSAALGAVLLAVQDVRSSRRAARAAESAAPGAVRLRRLPRPSDRDRSGGPIAGFDRWFARLVHETGLAWDPISAALVLVLGGIIAGGAMFLWREEPATATFGVLLGTAVPLIYLVHQRRRRIRRMQEQLAPALDMLARSVRAGESLDQALDVVGRHSPEPLAAEFRWCSKQLAMGLSMAGVMRLLVERVRLYDVRILTTTLTVHRQTGGNVAEVLERLAGVVRDRLNYRRQLRVATGAGRISAALVAGIGPLLFLFFFFFRPHYLDAMLASSLGQTILILAISLEAIGLIWTARLLKPTY